MAKTHAQPDKSTEEKIKEAARKVFTQKGFSATRTRDIAEEAGINLALLNYYFRSKEKLFEQIMMERLQQLFGALAPIMLNADISLETKIERMVDHYIELLIANPDLPIFILSEIRNDARLFGSRIPIMAIIEHSSFVQQIKEKQPTVHPFHFLMNLLGMVVFPFVAWPVFSAIPMVQQKGFENMMAERRRMIPQWIKLMLENPETL